MADTVGINVVFTDLVGSTELSSRLGPETTEALRVVHFGLLRSAMKAFDGREVKNLGDGLMVVFPSLGKAIDGSVAMQQAIARHNSSGKEPLGVRVGISTGDATEDDDDYFGEPVVEAARLCAQCESGQIIVSQLTTMLARSSGNTFTSIGDLELRGIPDPVPSFTVDWEPAATTAAIELPDRLHPDSKLPLAGRAQETEALLQACKSASAGERRMTLLAGEPGIGKTRLSAELAVSAHANGAIVLYGRCDEELSVPYQPWVEAVSYLTDHLDDATLGQLIEQHGPELALLLPQLRRQFPDTPTTSTADAETERYLLLQAVTSCLALVAETAPVLLVLDDLHWADGQTLTLLRHLFTNIASTSAVMVVGTYRDSDLEAGNPLIDTVAALRREPGVELLAVTGLDDVEIRQLVEISAQSELDDAGVRMALLLRQETAGNPFFAHEILRNLVETGDLYLDGDTWIVKDTFDELELPQSVRDVVGQRIARLGDTSVKALRAAAVIGREFDLALVATVTDADEDDLLDHFEAAIAAGVLAEVAGGDERFRFVHSLARTTLVADLSDGRTRRMHRKIAEALEAAIGDEPGDRVGELATHWMAAAAPIELDKAIHFAQLAGRRALGALAPDDAIRWFSTALEHLDLSANTDDRLRAELLVELGTAQQHLGEPVFRETLLAAGALAKTTGDTRLMIGAALANSRGIYSKLGAIDAERIAALEDALQAIGDTSPPERSLLMATLFSELEYAASYHERIGLINEAMDLARSLGDRAILVTVMNRFCLTSAVPHNLEARLEASSESLALARSLGDRSLEFWALCGSCLAGLGSGDLDRVVGCLDAMTRVATETGRRSFHWVTTNLRCSLTSALGDNDELESLAHQSLALGTEAGEPDAFDFFTILVMTVRRAQGRAGEIMEQLLEVGELNPSIEAYAAVAAMFLSRDGQPARAQALLDGAKARNFEVDLTNSWAVTTCSWAQAASELGDIDACTVLYQLLLPHAGQISCHMTFCDSSIDGVLGHLALVLDQPEKAEAHFAASEVTTTDFGAHFFAANDDLARATLHRQLGDHNQASVYLDNAIKIAQANGYTSIERRAHSMAESPE